MPAPSTDHPASLVLTRRQALSPGRTGPQVDALLRSGAWLTLRRGVYLQAPVLPDSQAGREAVRVQAAVLTSGVPSVGSHESAALVHGLPLFVPYRGPVLLSRLRAAGARRPDARTGARLVSVVPPCDRTVVLGAEVTHLARTAVDLARTRSALTAVIALDVALRRGVERTALLEVLERQRGWPGSARAKPRVLFADGRAESPLESIGRLRFHQLELPAPRLQVVVGGAYGPEGRVDFLFEDQRTVAEADGAVKYEQDPDGPPSRALFEEKQREDGIRRSGFEVFRFVWDEAVHRPEVLRARAEQAFALARR